MNVVALLESMWAWGGYNAPDEEAPRYFRINADNFSGRRLYSLVGDHRLLVTNSCRIVQRSANHHGTPDPQWVRSNLEFLTAQGMELLLVCGRVARETYAASGYQFKRVLYMDHPAARRWTSESLNALRSRIAKTLAEAQAEKVNQ